MQSDLSAYVETDRGRLVGLAYLLLGNRGDAEDAVQTALLRLTRNDLTHVQDLSSYARRAVVNECASWKRSLVRRERLHPVPVVGDEVNDLIDALDLGRALQRLNTKHRAVVVLRYFLDLDDESIAEIADCAPATVRSRLSRALGKLRAELEKGEN